MVSMDESIEVSTSVALPCYALPLPVACVLPPQAVWLYVGGVVVASMGLLQMAVQGPMPHQDLPLHCFLVPESLTVRYCMLLLAFDYACINAQLGTFTFSVFSKPKTFFCVFMHI
jgi:hypothetical protein